ncbi:hypothetical protein [Nocardia huaxiensis]|uniref:hypothetical protein n=1 Tax=Nocardia huaxiensis TaxID=2755382 RepID=UPI001E2B9BBA|nr:hypothetical protein [Nocardia huaxiensis]UFS97052.1 hypothetical protein LPY97_03710 [Nocardia huaxiensis]
MREFLAATLTFPTVLFSFALLVVVAYWLVVLAGAVDVDPLDADADVAGSGIGDRLGLGGVPATITLSLLIALAWFWCLAGSVVTAPLDLTGVAGLLIGCWVLVIAVIAAVTTTRVIVIPLRRAFAPTPQPTRDSLVGHLCVIRTGRVGPDFGQAELVSADGSSSIIQVRQTAEQASETPLSQGVSAIVYDYDSAAEIFWVAPVEGIS